MMQTNRHPIRRGFSIVEATLAVLLIGGAMVAAMNVAITASRANGAATQRRKAETLAHSLLAEVLALPAAGTDSTTAAAGARLNNFDHLLDFDGFSESPPQTIDGRARIMPGWRWSVSLVSRGSETIDGQSRNLRMYQVTATVALPDGTTVSVQGLRGNSTSVERVPVADTPSVIQVLMTVKVPDGGVIYAAPEAGSQPPPSAAQTTSWVN